jgi:thiamine biosynthesis lipoprotein
MSHCVETRRARPFLGTFVEIMARAANHETAQRALGVGFLVVAEVQRLMSRHDPASEVSRLNREARHRKVLMHRWTRFVLEAAERFAEESGGAFDITRGPDASWRDVVIDRRGWVHFRRDLTIDLGGIAKGFAVDCAVEVLRKAGAVGGLVNAGGDLRLFGDQAQPVQVRDPLAPGRPAAVVLLRDRALASSANYFTPALLDGRSGTAILDEVSVTVGAADCLTADALTKIALALREDARPILDHHRADAFLLEGNLPARWLARNHAPQFNPA